MKDEEDDNIIPNDDENNSDENPLDENQEGDDSDEIINVDAKHFEGQHFYENQEEEGRRRYYESNRNVQRLVFGLCFVCNSRTCSSGD